MKRRNDGYTDARELAKRDAGSSHAPSKPGWASDYIKHFEELAQRRPGIKVVLYVRLSGRTQHRKQNFRHQLTWLRREVKLFGVRIVKVYLDVCSGWVFDDGRDVLLAAVRHAKKSNAVIVAISTDRLIRNRDFDDKRNKAAVPTVKEFKALRQMADGVTLATLFHPDTPSDVVHGAATRRGEQAKKRKHPRKRKRYQPSYKNDEIAISKAYWLTLAGRAPGPHGKKPKLTWKKIAEETGRKESVIRSWYYRFWRESFCKIWNRKK